jgi:hypothetical protein
LPAVAVETIAHDDAVWELLEYLKDCPEPVERELLPANFQVGQEPLGFAEFRYHPGYLLRLLFVRHCHSPKEEAFMIWQIVVAIVLVTAAAGDCRRPSIQSCSPSDYSCRAQNEQERDRYEACLQRERDEARRERDDADNQRQRQGQQRRHCVQDQSDERCYVR